MSKYSIQLASKLSGVGVHTLRAWEKRYQAVVPSRTDTGRRLYSDKDIEKLKLLRELCSLGSSISTIADQDIESLKQTLSKFGQPISLSSSAPTSLANEERAVPQEVLQNLLLGLEAYKLDVISHEFSKLRTGLNPRELAMEVLLPLLQEVGIRVSNGTFTVAQEHAFSSIVKFHVGQIIYQNYEFKHKSPCTFALATPSNDHHEFGIIAAALLCCHYNIRFYYFGTNLPAESLIEASQSVEANNIILGTTEVDQVEVDQDLNQYFDYCLANLAKDQKLIVGGNGFFSLDRFNRSNKFSYMPTIKYLDEYLKNIIE